MPPLDEVAVDDAPMVDEILDPSPGGTPGACHVEGCEPHALDGASHGRTQAVADLLQNERVGNARHHVPQAGEEATEVRVAARLQGLLKRVGVQGETVRLDLLDRAGDLGGPVAAIELRHPEIAEKEHVRSQVAHGERVPGLGVLEHHPLRSEHEADPHPLGGDRQVAVDRGGEFRPAGHGPDKQRGPKGPAQKGRARIDSGQVGLRKGAVGEHEALETGGDGLELHVAIQAHLHVPPLAATQHAHKHTFTAGAPEGEYPVGHDSAYSARSPWRFCWAAAISTSRKRASP